MASHPDFKTLPDIDLASNRQVALLHQQHSTHLLLFQERKKMDAFADFYCIIVTMEHLERAFVRDIITDKQ